MISQCSRSRRDRDQLQTGSAVQLGFARRTARSRHTYQAGIGASLSIAVGDNSVWFIDALATPTSLTVMERAELDGLIAELILLGGMMFCMNEQIYANKP